MNSNSPTVGHSEYSTSPGLPPAVRPEDLEVHEDGSVKLNGAELLKRLQGLANGDAPVTAPSTMIRIDI